MDPVSPLHWRYAVKKFDPNRILKEEQVSAVLESIRLTPSSMGLQPYRVILVKKKEVREKLVSASFGQAKVAEASHLLVFAAFTNIDETLMESHLTLVAKIREQKREDLEGYANMILGFLKNRSEEQKREWAKKQTYIALGTALFACAAMGIDSCPMEGFQPEHYDRILGLDRMGLTSVLVLPMGYRATDDSYANLKKVRKSIENLVHTIE